MKQFGFFRELSITGGTGDSIFDHVAPTPMANTAETVRYLQACPAIARFAVLSPNVLDPAQGPIHGCSIQTDGTWVWPSDIALYVEKGLQLPSEFTDRMRSSNWAPPELTSQALQAVRREVFNRPAPGAQLE